MTQNTTSMSMDCKKTIKIDIACGFRGSGKTTLIKRMAEEIWEGENIVFLQNESGHEKLSRVSESSGCQVIEVQKGCICCTGAQLMIQTILEVVKEYQPDRIILEAAETARIGSLRSMLSQEMEDTYQLDHVLYVCNIKNYHIKMLISGNYFENELRQAPVIFLNHMNELEKEEGDKILKSLKEISPESTIVKEDWKIMKPEELRAAYENGKIASVDRKENRKSVYAKINYKGYRSR